MVLGQQGKVFIYKNPNYEIEKFVIGIQIEWMLDKMVELSHNNIISIDSTFSTNLYEVRIANCFYIFFSFALLMLSITKFLCIVDFCALINFYALQYQFYTLLAFDSLQSDLPVDWVVTYKNGVDDIVEWLEILKNIV